MLPSTPMTKGAAWAGIAARRATIAVNIPRRRSSGSVWYIKVHLVWKRRRHRGGCANLPRRRRQFYGQRPSARPIQRERRFWGDAAPHQPLSQHGRRRRGGEELEPPPCQDILGNVDVLFATYPN